MWYKSEQKELITLNGVNVEVTYSVREKQKKGRQETELRFDTVPFQTPCALAECGIEIAYSEITKTSGFVSFKDYILHELTEILKGVSCQSVQIIWSSGEVMQIDSPKTLAWFDTKQTAGFNLNGVNVKIEYSPDKFNEMDIYKPHTIQATHLEFNSVDDGRPNDLTETGYYSFFVSGVDMSQFVTMREMVESAVKGMMKDKKNKSYSLSWDNLNQREIAVQGTLFNKPSTEQIKAEADPRETADTEMSEDEFYGQYELEKNHINPDSAYEGSMFETYGEELHYIKSLADSDKLSDRKRVWTIVEGDEDMILLSGFHTVNRLGYLLTTEPVQEQGQVAVTLYNGELEGEFIDDEPEMIEAE